MHAMIVDSRSSRLDLTQIAFLEAGIHVTGSGSLSVADCCLRRAVVDLLVLDAEVAGRRTGEIIALAERRNPRLVTLILTQDVAGMTDHYCEVFQSVHCVLEADVPPSMVARMAQASLAGRTIARVAAQKNVAPAMAEPDPAPQAEPQPAPVEDPVMVSRDAAGTEAPRASALAQMVAARQPQPPAPTPAPAPAMTQAPVQAAARQEAPTPVFASSRRRRLSPHQSLMAMGA